MEKTKVLIVEDDLPMAVMLKSYLDDLGFNVVDKVVDGKSAIEKAREHNPDVILMDISIEGDMDGITTANAISTDYHIPIIFTSATSEDDIVKILQENRYPYQYACITKPIIKTILKMKIEMAIKVKKMLG